MYVQNRDAGYVGIRMLRMEPPVRKGSQRSRFMDAVREDIQVVSVVEMDYRGQGVTETGDPQWWHLTSEAKRRKEWRMIVCTFFQQCIRNTKEQVEHQLAIRIKLYT